MNTIDLKPFPKSAVLCGIEFNISEHEGLIVFSQSSPCYGCYTRISFNKPEYGMWQMSFNASAKAVPVEHVIAAYKLIKEFRGDTWGRGVRQ